MSSDEAKVDFDKNTSDGEIAKLDLSKQEIDWWQLFLTSMLLVGPFLLGMIICQLSNAAALMNIYVNQSSFPVSDKNIRNVWSFGGFFPIGGMFGALIASKLVDSLGRRMSTLIFFIILLIGNILGIISVYVSFGILVVSRFLSGLATAALMVTALCWMFERLPSRLESIFKPLVQLIINCGIILASVLNLDEVMSGLDSGMFLVPVIFAIVAIVFCFLTAESVKWKLLKGQSYNDVVEDMKRLRGKGFIEAELKNLKAVVDKEMSQSHMSLKEFLTSKRLRPAIVCAIFLHMAQQLSGINAIVSFAQLILGNIPNVNLYVVGILILNAMFSLLFCLIVARFPRKSMLLFGHGLMALGYLIFIITMYSMNTPSVALLIFSLCVVLFAFQSAPGPMVWFITFEIFPSNAVGVAQGICSSTNWMANSFIYFAFPLLEPRMSQQNILLIFMVINILVCIFIWFFIVETKDRSVDEILEEYGQKFGIES